jgi:hypothetical protein
MDHRSTLVETTQAVPVPQIAPGILSIAVFNKWTHHLLKGNGNRNFIFSFERTFETIY